MEFRSRLLKVKTLARYKDLKVRDLGFFFEAALVFEDCYDDEIPLVLRLKKLGYVLTRANQFLNIDHELLAWAAAARWLARIHSFALAALSLAEYKALSLRLSDGTNDDALGTCSDLLASSWFAVHGLPQKSS